MHPAILESQVEKVILALGNLRMETYHAGAGSLWPVFLAGCEATKKTHRDSMLRLVEEAEKQCVLAPFKMAKDIMTELWQIQDDHLAANRRQSMPTWIDVLKQRQIWPMFC